MQGEPWRRAWLPNFLVRACAALVLLALLVVLSLPSSAGAGAGAGAGVDADAVVVVDSAGGFGSRRNPHPARRGSSVRLAGGWISKGCGFFHSMSPMRWSSQMLSEKKSIPGPWRVPVPAAVADDVSAARCERRNMLLFPTMQGATSTVLMAV